MVTPLFARCSFFHEAHDSLLACLFPGCTVGPSCLLQMTLFDRDDNVVAELQNLESGGLTQDFEIFYFDHPAKGSKIRLDLKGTTAGKWNGIVEASKPLSMLLLMLCVLLEVLSLIDELLFEENYEVDLL